MTGIKSYYLYIITNRHKTVLYTGVTNDLQKRLQEHRQSALSENGKTFTGRYKIFYLLYYETFGDIKLAIAREKEIKGWARNKKVILIENTNTEWLFLNETI